MTPHDEGAYDYIIIGAGSAGCVLAYRLGEDPNTRILVLEAGGDDRAVMVQMPSALTIPMNTVRFNWGRAADQPAAWAGLGRIVFHKRNVLGARQPDGL